MEIDKVKLRARLSDDGDHVLCAIPRCGGILAHIGRRDLTEYRERFPELPREVAAIFVREGYHRFSDGSWQPSNHALGRDRRGIEMRDRTMHEINKHLPRIVDGAATPEEREVFRDILNASDISSVVSRQIDHPEVIYCPKCNRPIVVDPSELLTQPRATR